MYYKYIKAGLDLKSVQSCAHLHKVKTIPRFVTQQIKGVEQIKDQEQIVSPGSD